MGSSVSTSIAADSDLQRAILEELKDVERTSVISVNDVIIKVRRSIPNRLSDRRLAQVVSEAAMFLGLVPVFDPDRPCREAEVSGRAARRAAKRRARLGSRPASVPDAGSNSRAILLPDRS